MEEKIAEDAATAVDTGETAIRDSKIYASAQDGMFRVKYLMRQAGNSVLIHSHNSAFYGDKRPLRQPDRYRHGIFVERAGMKNVTTRRDNNDRAFKIVKIGVLIPLVAW